MKCDQEDIIRIHEVRYFFVKSPASSHIKIRCLMYELVGGCPFTSWTLHMGLQGLP